MLSNIKLSLASAVYVLSFVSSTNALHVPQHLEIRDNNSKKESPSLTASPATNTYSSESDINTSSNSIKARSVSEEPNQFLNSFQEIVNNILSPTTTLEAAQSSTEVASPSSSSSPSIQRAQAIAQDYTSPNSISQSSVNSPRTSQSIRYNSPVNSEVSTSSSSPTVVRSDTSRGNIFSRQRTALASTTSQQVSVNELQSEETSLIEPSTTAVSSTGYSSSKSSSIDSNSAAAPSYILSSLMSALQTGIITSSSRGDTYTSASVNSASGSSSATAATATATTTTTTASSSSDSSETVVPLYPSSFNSFSLQLASEVSFFPSIASQSYIFESDTEQTQSGSSFYTSTPTSYQSDFASSGEQVSESTAIASGESSWYASDSASSTTSFDFEDFATTSFFWATESGMESQFVSSGAFSSSETIIDAPTTSIESTGVNTTADAFDYETTLIYSDFFSSIYAASSTTIDLDSALASTASPVEPEEDTATAFTGSATNSTSSLLEVTTTELSDSTDLETVSALSTSLASADSSETIDSFSAVSGASSDEATLDTSITTTTEASSSSETSADIFIGSDADDDTATATSTESSDESLEVVTTSQSIESDALQSTEASATSSDGSEGIESDAFETGTSVVAFESGSSTSDDQSVATTTGESSADESSQVGYTTASDNTVSTTASEAESTSSQDVPSEVSKAPEYLSSSSSPASSLSTSEPVAAAAEAPATTSTSSTKNWLPSSLVMAETPSSGLLTASQTNNVQASPTPDSTSGLPRAITPEVTGSFVDGYSVITVGFKAALNYPFVVNHTITSAQIFSFLPDVLKFPFKDSKKFDNVAVIRLIPYQASNIDYTITVAEVYFPTDSISALSHYITTEGSLIYRNPDPTRNTLASLIDSRISLTGLAESSEQTSSSSSHNGVTVNPNGSMDATYTDQESVNKGRVAGITIGAAAGCGIYMSLMVLLFRRFRKSNKNITLPVSDSESNFCLSDEGSLVTTESGSGFSAIFSRINHGGIMSVHDDHTDRETMVQLGRNGGENISEPVQASNSLGWYH
ncbi:MSB2 [Candida oxycetoniae]|uniref:MSB2 n=1 Tax=Candida oxycetoniae TaxID=497107 RepID=A0AAI9WYX2_9ASCO|nr:MSB2 [Candida oxycetoniae]KAI3405767.2 MSB2 [Candida oxycetoniae]